MRVIVLSQYYRPEPIPKPSELAESMKSLGHEVSVITGVPNYPNGEIYDNYKARLLQKETIDGVPVVRTYEYAYHGKNAIGRFANYLSFALSAPLAIWKTPKADVMYVWHPPLTIGIAAWIIAKFKRIPFVYDVQDIWPEAAVLSGIMRPGFVVRCLSVLERFVYKRADHLITVTEGAKRNLISKGVPASKVTALPHWVDDSIFDEPDAQAVETVRREQGWEGRFVVMFAGNMGLVQGLETVLESAERLRERSDVVFVFVGDGADRGRLEELTRTKGLEPTVKFVGRQPMTRMPLLLAAADAVLVHLKDSELSDYVVPSKTMAYLAAGRPIIMGMNGAAADIVQAANAGTVAKPEDPESLAMAVTRIVEMTKEERDVFGANGRKYLAEHFARRIVVPRYVKLLETVMKNSAG